ncbi:MAG: YicC family protein [Gammaproteobacteria bacterium]|nr:YicC family protein [Gammaproteobacteria bacterium]MDH3756837.1 YicC family protein [Gammaproteobacteria bacterium]MDH3847650.1 YicC family protein [Gammaproteobacteria bacterium]MDH3907985.1 YicC family protein [Gammaproteobacteria bacterium]MDH4003962.1 YicC family protein [Gammaproteobacteria bacterium]
MLHSMTGFARESAEVQIGALTWEIRAVNHRYLDVQFKLPDEMRAHEQAFRQAVTSNLNRGKVECSLHFRRAFDRQAELQINTGLVELIGKRIKEMSAALPATGAVNPFDVLRWPGVVEQAEIEAEPLFEAALPLLEKALVAICSMRASEGSRIAEMLESRCTDIVSLSESVRARMPEVLEAARTRQRERIEKLNVEADPARLETELALIAQKLDVDEELDRLDSHLVEIRDIVARDEPVGRRLDFLMQELNREANTLASKSNDTETTRASVELKVLIEQMREQIQNVE